MKKLITILSLIILLNSAVCLLLATQQVSNPAPESKTDIFDKSTGVFLDTDLALLEKAANEAYQKGDFEKAATSYLELLRYDIHNTGALYNLACCYGLLGKEELASLNLKRAVKAGYDDLGHIQEDKDFDKVRESMIFKTTMDSIKAITSKQTDPSVTKIYMPGNAFVPVYIHLPAKYDKSKKYSLIIGLHGFGDNAQNFAKLWKSMDQDNTIFACPEALYPMPEGNKLGYSWGVMDSLSKEDDKAARLQTENNVAEITKKLQATYSISSTYLLGFSQGCGLAYTAGINHYQLYKGLICFGGWLDTDWLSDNQLMRANKLKVAIVHGSEDNVVSFDNAEKADSKLASMDYAILFKPFKGAHQVSGIELKRALDWIMK